MATETVSRKPKPAVMASRDPMLRYGFYAGLVLATLCFAFTVIYISLYSFTTTKTFDQHHGEYVDAKSHPNLNSVLLARTAQNKTLLQSCGIVAGIAFGFLGFSLFLLGIEGTSDVAGKMEDYTVTLNKVAPGSLILIAAIVLIAVSATHRIELDFSPDSTSVGSPASAADAASTAQAADADNRLGKADNSAP